MYNKYLRPASSTLLANKLGVLATQLQSSALPKGTLAYPTLESVTDEARRILAILSKDLSAPLFTLQKVLRDVEPEVSQFNRDFQLISNDLEVLFSEFENLEGVMTGNFDYMVSKLNGLHGKLKDVEEAVNNYARYWTGNRDSIYLGDTFASSKYVDQNSKLLSSDQLEVDTNEGIVTLPRNKAKQKEIKITNLPVINSASNGQLGNNEEVGATSHNQLSVLVDGQSDSWVEYERVVTFPDGVPLVLDLVLTLSKEEIINFIGINPYVFGVKSQIEILALDTSRDGTTYTSIRTGMAMEDDHFTLSPAASKYAGQGLFSFLPRKVRQIHIVLVQRNTYPINTSSGITKSRYAIGLRDIWVEARPYKATGELISNLYDAGTELKKVRLLTNQVPEGTDLVTLTSSISPDDGSAWHAFKGKKSIEFNGVSADTIKTASPVTSLRYKLAIQRNDAKFAEVADDLSLENVTELHQPPTTTPFLITLQNSPYGKVKLVDPSFGSRNIDTNRYQVASGKGALGAIFQLPWTDIPLTLTKVYSSGTYKLVPIGPEKVYVDNKLWTAGILSTAASTDEVYELDYHTGFLKFGDGTNGKAPTENAVVSLMFDEERIFPGAKLPHRATLQFPTVADKKQISLRFVEAAKAGVTILQKGAKNHLLVPYVSSSYSLVFSDTAVFSTPKTFVNGILELSSAGDYSIDYTSGRLFSYTPTSTSAETSVTYYHTPYDVADFDVLANESGVFVDVKDWQTLTPAKPETVPTGVNYFNLANLAVVAGSLIFGASSSAFQKEVDFINGQDELLGLIRAEEVIAPLSSGGYPANVSFNLSLKVVSTTGYGVSFSNRDIFVTEKANLAAVTSTGDYFVDKTATPPTVTVRIAAAQTVPGSITYYYLNSTVNLAGRYSINYNTGEVFTYTQTGAGITVTYQYTDYRISYPVAREVPTEDFEVSGKNLTISDREILRSGLTTQFTGGKSAKFYQVSYMKSTTEDQVPLKEYYSPIITSYFLKALPVGKLV